MGIGRWCALRLETVRGWCVSSWAKQTKKSRWRAKRGKEESWGSFNVVHHSFKNTLKPEKQNETDFWVSSDWRRGQRGVKVD